MPSLIHTFLSRAPGRFERAPENAVASGTIGGELTRNPEEWNVYIETSPGSNEYDLSPAEIDWTTLTVGLNSTGSKATVVVRALDASKLTSPGKLGSAHLIHLLDDMNVNCRILIAKGRGPALFESQLDVLFSGYVMAGSASWSDKHQGIAWTVVSEGEEKTRTVQAAQIIGRIMRKYPFREVGQYLNSANYDLIEVDVLPPVFNAEGKANMLDQVLQLPNVAGMRVFAGDGDKGATFWHYANALRYVAAFYASFAGIDVSAFMLDTNDFIGVTAGGSSTDPFTHHMLQKVEGVSIASMSAFEALAALCQAGGLHFEIPRRYGNQGNSSSHYLRVVAPIANRLEERSTRARYMVAPEARDIPRDPPFSNYSGYAPADVAQRNSAQMAHLSADVRVVNTPVVVGGASDFEVTLLQRPGWKPNANLDLDMTGLDAEGKKAKARAALEFWENEFGEDEEEREDNAVPKSKYHTQHPDHSDVAEIGRLWIFPDTAAYMTDASLTASDYKRKQAPWDRALYFSPYGFDAAHVTQVYTDVNFGGGLPRDVVEKWALRRRPYGDMLSRANLQVADLAPRVEINFTDTSPDTAMNVVSGPNGTLIQNPNWIPFTGSVVIDKDRAALWIKEDNLLLSPKLDFESKDGAAFSYLRALIGLDENDNYIGPHLFVRVTCTVRGDQRLQARPTKTQNVLYRERSKVIDLGFDQFVEKTRIRGNSALIDIPESDPKYKDRDDRDKLSEFARSKQALLDRLTVGGDWEANYIETGIRLGDAFRGVEGMAIDFATWPTVSAIEWSKDPEAGYRTKFHLDDLRHAPEVGSEA